MKKLNHLLKRHGLCLSMIIGAVASLALAGFATFAEECERIPDEVLRLHIIANSDSEEDQGFKYALRDYLLHNFSTSLGACDSLESAKEISRRTLPQIEKASRAFAAENGYESEIRAEVTEMYFTTRVYDNFTLPAGNYDALRITIGEGNGANWWCVMFPPLCVPAVADNRAADAINIPHTDDGPKVKFALYELLSGLLGKKSNN